MSPQPHPASASRSLPGAFLPYIRNRVPGDGTQAARDFYESMKERRTIREFSTRAVDPEIIRHCLLTAGTAPSGAHRQPWKFCVVTNAALKKRIRQAAEAEEEQFYGRRAPQEMLEALRPMGTTAHKPHLEEAPCLIAIFMQSHTNSAGDERAKVNYYPSQSVGIATGLLIAALHQSGLATLTHTPSPMGFLSDLLGRPAHEKPFLLLVTGYPKEGVQVPNLRRKSLAEIADFYDAQEHVEL